MRTIWTILSVLAIANLLALVGFVGWLAATERLTVERAEEMRDLLRETAPAREARLEREEAEAERQAAEAEAERRSQIPPVTAAERLRIESQADEADRQRVQRLTREVQDLRRTLAREREAFEQRVDEFEAERARFETMRDRITEIEGDAQFQQAVRALESQKPDRARDMLLALVDQGETDQAVAYFDAMSARQAAKVLGAIEDPAVATDLLERLRTHGLEARAP